MAQMTFALASEISRESVDGAIHYSAVEDDDILNVFPFTFYPGGTKATFKQRLTLPAAEWRAEADAMTAKTASYATRAVELKNLYDEMQVPLAHMAISDVFNQKQSDVEAMALGMGVGLRAALAASSSVTATVGADILLGVLGWVSAKPCPNCTLGLWEVEFDDAPTDRIRIKEPGATDFGAWQVATADLDEVAVYAADTTQYLYITMDVSESAAGGDYTTTSLGGLAADGITVATSKEPDGLFSWCHPTRRVWGNLTADPANAGAALALAQLDWLIDNCVGPKSEKLFVMRRSTRRAFKALMIAAAGLEYVDTWMGNKLARPNLAYDGIPIMVSDGIPAAQKCGVDGTCLTATSVHLVRVNQQNGFGCFYFNAGPPAARVNDNGIYRPVPLPIYNRIVNGNDGEMEGYPDQLLRMDTWVAPFLKNTNAHAEVCGINQ